MALATLSIDLEAKLAKFQAGMDRAAYLAEKNAAATEAAWRRAGATLAGLGATLAGLFAGVSLAEFVRGNVDALDKLNDVADATGASIENISALEDLARRTGTSLDVATTAMVKLNGALNQASPNSPVAQAFQAIGIEANKLKGLDPAEALRQVAVALSGYADDGNKARLVQELFGKSLREVAPLLNDLAEKGSLVATTTTEQAKEAEKFNKQLFELQTNAALAARSLTSTLLPKISQLLESYAKLGLYQGLVLPGLGLDDVSKKSAALELLQAQVTRSADGVDRLAEAMKRSPNDNFLAVRYDKARARLAALQKQAAQASDQLKELVGGAQPDYSNEGRSSPKPSIKDPEPGKPQDVKAARAEQISQAQRALASYITELQRELDKTVELSEQQKTLNLLKSLGSLGEVPQVREVVGGLERQITLAKQDAAIRADNLRITQAQEAAQKSLNDELYRLSGRADDDRKRALTAQLEQQLASGAQYSKEELDRIVNGIAGIATKGKDSIDQLDELTKQFGRNVQNALGDTLEQTLAGHFDGIGEKWLDLLRKMAAQAAAQQLGQQLFGDFFKSGNLGGFFGKAFGGGGSGGGFGDALASLTKFLPFFAAGGDFGGGLRIVGEKGPELEATGPARIFNADQTRRILSGSGGGARPLQVTWAPVYQVDSRSDRGQVLSDIEAGNRRSQRQLLDFLRAKGVL